MSTQFEQRIAGFAQWRADMIAGIESYKTWLDANGYADIQQSLRIYDLIESLKHDRVTLAFIAEFSRGKTELINAMLFGRFKRRLLPSDVGRTTMCPTELYFDPAEEPCIRLLPIESRRRGESIASLRHKPVEWIKLQLNVDSEAELAQALQVLAQSKKVAKEEALALGMYDQAAANATTVPLRDSGEIEVPAWRHALINYPHPLLQSGLVVLDTPGLNALGAEPELTMSMIPHAHAVVFLLAMDSGVTRSDLELWQRYVKPRAPRTIAVLNKVDLLWDDISDEADIDASVRRQLEETARLLELPRASVLPLSARKALVARVRNDAALLAKSGILVLEQLLADEIVPAKREILRAAVAREIGAMVESSRRSIVAQFNAARAEHKSLAELAGKNRSVAQAMLARLESERANYAASVQRYQSASEQVQTQGNNLLATLSDEALEGLMNTDRAYIEQAWTTAGLIKNMQGLFDHFTAQTDRILRFSSELRALIEDTYTHFHEQFGFEKLNAPVLNLERHALAMRDLKQATIEFCHHPRQIMTEKHFLVSNFYQSLVAEARRIFDLTREDTRAWLRTALSPLNASLHAYQTQLNKRIENLHTLQTSLHSVADRTKQLERQLLALKSQHDVLIGIKSNIEGDAAPGAGDALAPAAPVIARQRAV